MKICENGLRVHLTRKQQKVGDYVWLIEADEAREWLFEVVDEVTGKEPAYWLLVEWGYSIPFINPDADPNYEEYEASVVLHGEFQLLKGDTFTRLHHLFEADGIGLLSITEPDTEDPRSLLAAYEEIAEKHGAGLQVVVDSMKSRDIYFYCYEWNDFIFFSHEENIELIKRMALSVNLPITEGILFKDR